MPLHDRLANAEQKSSPLRVVVVVAANSRQNVRHSGGFQTGGRQPRGYLVQRGFGRAFNGLEQDVAVKSVADDDIRRAAQGGCRLNVADKAEGLFRQQGVRRLDSLTSLFGFGTVGQQRDARRGTADASHIGVTQMRKGRVQFRAAVDVRAAIQKQERLPRRIRQLHRKDGAQARQLAQDHDGGDQHSAGRTAGDDAARSPLVSQPHGGAQGGIRALIRLHRILVVAQSDRRIHNLIPSGNLCRADLRRHGREYVGVPAQVEEQRRVPDKRPDRAPAQLLLRRVRAQKIDCQVNHLIRHEWNPFCRG